MLPRVKDIRDQFLALKAIEHFVLDKTGVKTIELVGTSFLADEPMIFGTPNDDYIRREIEWYDSQSLSVKDIPGGAPAIWTQVASKDEKALINSNYGWCIYSRENGDQYSAAMTALIRDRYTRRAIMIYTRPSMQIDYNKGGMSDFMCTNSVQYLIRNGCLHALVSMRSNDVVFGYRNDWAWQFMVLQRLVKDLNHYLAEKVQIGNIIWNAGSLHVYERHFKLIE